ncbi:hypothetical protein TNCV_2687691 [Trichonephila clavipes]|nr:hypothetical protein TNCV_2687691 [Trichonephila clavipes]
MILKVDSVKNIPGIHGLWTKISRLGKLQRTFRLDCARNRRPTRVQLLNARHRAERLAWAGEHRYRNVEDWKRVAWSDESPSDYVTKTGG